MLLRQLSNDIKTQLKAVKASRGISWLSQCLYGMRDEGSSFCVQKKIYDRQWFEQYNNPTQIRFPLWTCVSLWTSDLEFPLDLRVLDSKWSSNYLSDGANSKKGRSPHDGGSKKIEHRTKETGADYSLGKDYKSEIDFDIDVGGYN